MAEKRYTAIFDAQDRVSDKMKKIEQATTRARDANGRFVSATKKAEEAQERMKRKTDESITSMERMKRAMMTAGTGIATFGRSGVTAMKGIGSAIGGIWSRLTSLPSLIAGAASAWGLFKAGELVIGGAMQKELTQMQMGALLADQGKGMDLFKIVQEKAMTSMFSEKDFAGAATTFLPITKDFKEIERLMSINERLAASNPLEGMEGASFSLREALSGDIASIADRFNISKSGLRENGFDSAASWQQNLEAVDRTLDKMGYTAKYVDDVNDSAYAQWELFKSNSLKLFADTGEGILSKLKEPLKELNTIMGSSKMSTFVDKFGDFLAGKLSSGVQYVEDMNLKWSDFERILSGSGDIFSGVGDSFAIMMGTFDGEKGKSPREVFEQFAESIEAGGKAIHDFNESFAPFVDKVRGFVEWSKGPSKDDENGRKSKGLLMWAGDVLTGRGTDWHYTPGAEQTPWEALMETFRINGQLLDKINFNPNAGSSGRLRGSHMGGLSYVPSDNYAANLHQGERVLTASENRAYSQGSGGVAINIQTMHVRNDQDIELIGEALARRLEMR